MQILIYLIFKQCPANNTIVPKRLWYNLNPQCLCSIRLWSQSQESEVTASTGPGMHCMHFSLLIKDSLQAFPSLGYRTSCKGNQSPRMFLSIWCYQNSNSLLFFQLFLCVCVVLGQYRQHHIIALTVIMNQGQF